MKCETIGVWWGICLELYIRGIAESEDSAAEDVDMLESVLCRGLTPSFGMNMLPVAEDGTGSVATDLAEENDGLRPPTPADKGGEPVEGGDSDNGVDCEGVAVSREGDARGVVCDVARINGCGR